jgi:pre-mRNA-splicing factor SYF2
LSSDLQQFASILNNSKLQTRARRKEEKVKANRFEMHDFHNSEGQHRNYERNLKSLPRAAANSTEDTADTFLPALNTTIADEAKERDGARHLAGEMKRRIEKQAKKKRERMDFEETDISSINKRNKRFNQKISRSFDKHTAGIRQDLERGTAL